MKTNKSQKGGIGFLGALQVLLIGLKLIGAIEWSWIWVFIPFWGPIVFLFVFAVWLSMKGEK